MPSKRSVSKSNNPGKKIPYRVMIIDAVTSLGERSGSSREAIWKFIQMRYPEEINEKKFFLTSLKRELLNNPHLAINKNNRARITLDYNFR
jgi:hypothetical protein